jgi:hypothetical protein
LIPVFYGLARESHLRQSSGIDTVRDGSIRPFSALKSARSGPILRILLRTDCGPLALGKPLTCTNTAIQTLKRN